MKILIFGSDSIEFGWTVATFIPAMRKAAEGYDRVVAVCKEQNRYLYEDFATDFETYEQKGKHDMWYVSRKPDILCKVPKNMRRKYPGATYYIPSRSKCIDWPRKYFMYGDIQMGAGYDLVIHARAESKYGQQGRNWPKDNYEMLLSQLKNPRACSIGTKAYHIPGTDDLRNIPLEDLCQVIASSRVMVGPSSGPCHLSHLCGTPVVVWTHAKKEKAINATNRQRYEKLWRGFDTEVVVVDESDWNPTIGEIAIQARRFL